jgi:hypothetical protein
LDRLDLARRPSRRREQPRRLTQRDSLARAARRTTLAYSMRRIDRTLSEA